MALPTVTIDNVNGSNTAASGAGPATALSGTAAATAASTVVTLSVDGPDLSGVATDGSAVIWIQSSSGRMFAKITAVDNTLKTVTVANAYANTESGKLWGIGGKRKDFETTNTNTKNLFLSTDAQPGWTIDILQTGTNYTLTATITVSCAGDTTTGRIIIKSSSATRPIITSATNSVYLFTCSASHYVEFRHLNLTHTATTRGVAFGRSTAPTPLYVADCVVDGCLSFNDNDSASATIYVSNTWIKNCTTTVQVCAAWSISRYDGCEFTANSTSAWILKNNLGTGLTASFTNCIIDTCKGLYDGNVNRADVLEFRRNTVLSTNSDAIKLEQTSNFPSLYLVDNAFWSIGGYAINNSGGTAASIAALTYLDTNNAFGSITSGNRNNMNAGTSDIALTASPVVGSGNYGLNTTAGGGAGCRAAGWPAAFPDGTTIGYPDVGAVQHQDPAQPQSLILQPPSTY